MPAAPPAQPADDRSAPAGPGQVPDRELAGMADIGAPAVEQTEQLHRRRTAVAELGAALRELVAATVATEVDDVQLRQVADQARVLAQRLRASSRAAGTPSSVDDLRRGQRYYNPVVGPGSPLAPPMRIEITEEGAVGRCTLGLPYEGPLGFGHGGISALLLDQIMGYATAAAGHPAVTGRLQVRYRAAVPLLEPLLVRGSVIDVLGVRVAARGSIAAAARPEDVLVEAEGRFLTLRREQAQRLFGPPHRPRSG